MIPRSSARDDTESMIVMVDGAVEYAVAHNGPRKPTIADRDPDFVSVPTELGSPCSE